MDNETKEVLTVQDTIKKLTEHEGWGFVRSLLMSKIVDLQDINDVDTTSPENAVRDIKARQFAGKILLEWLNEIEGTVEQSKSNNSLLPSKDSYIVRG